MWLALCTSLTLAAFGSLTGTSPRAGSRPSLNTAPLCPSRSDLAHAREARQAPRGTADQDVAQLVAKLASSDPASRELNEHRLALALDAGGVAPLRAALAELDSVEAARRVAVVLGSQDRLLGLSVELALDPEPLLSRAGVEGIRAQLIRWSVSAFDEPEVAGFDPRRLSLDLPRTLQQRATLDLSIDPTGRGILGALDRLDRLGGGIAPIVIDPRLATRERRRPDVGHDQNGLEPGGTGVKRDGSATPMSRLDGTWIELLEGVCRLHGAAFQLQGFRFPGETRPQDMSPDDDSSVARAWIHVVPAGTTDTDPIGRDLRTPAGEVIIGWCLDACREGDAARQSAAARALATLGWPAALGWLEQRWLERGDIAALEGVLTAAARGRVAPSLQRADVIRRILEFVDGRARTLEAEADRIEDLSGEERDDRSATLGRLESALDDRVRSFALGLARLAPVSISYDSASGSTPFAQSPLFTQSAQFAPIGAVFAEDFDAAPATGRWLRLVAASGPAPLGKKLRMRALLAFEGRLEARSRRAALRALAGSAGALDFRAPVLDDPDVFFRGVGASVAGIGIELGLAGVNPAPEAGLGWVERYADDRPMLAELLLWAAILGAGEGDALPPWAQRACALSAKLAKTPRPAFGPDPIARAAVGARGTIWRDLAALLARGSADLPSPENQWLDRARVHQGLADRELQHRVLRRALEDVEAVDRRERVEAAWMDLASLVATPEVGPEALQALQASGLIALGPVTFGPDDRREGLSGGGGIELMKALEVAISKLRAARKDVELESFLDALEDAASSGKHPLAGAFFAPDWPAPPFLPPRDLERLDPHLPPR